MTATELQGGEGRASVFDSTLKIDADRCVRKFIVRGRTDGSVGGERSEAVQAAGPISGEVGRTSVLEGKVNEERPLDIT